VDIERKKALLQRKRELRAQATPPMATPPPGLQAGGPEDFNPEGDGYTDQPTVPGKEYTAFKQGLATSGIETGLGIKGLILGATKEDEDVLRMAREDAKAAGGWGTAGNVAGDIAQMAVPASKMAKVGMLPGATRTAKAASMAGQVALGAGFEGMQAPQEGQTRGEAAMMGGAGAALGVGGGRVLDRALKGIKQTPEAEYLASIGARLTPGQAAEPGLVRTAEYVAGILPILSRTVAKQKESALDSLNFAVLNRAAAPGKTVDKTGHEGLKQIKKGFTETYGDAWAKAGQLDQTALYDQIARQSAAKAISADAATPLKRIEEAFDSYLGGPTTKNLHGLDNKIRGEIRKIQDAKFPNIELLEHLKDMRGSLRSSIAPEAAEALRAIDQKYGAFKTIEAAAGSTAGIKEGGSFGAKQLVKAVKKVGKQHRTAYGDAPLQEAAKAASQTIGRNDPVPLMSFIRGASKNMQIPFASEMMLDPLMRKGADFAMGRTATQKVGTEVAKALRAMGITEATAGATTLPPLLTNNRPEY
jgi:hypothetical protein